MEGAFDSVVITGTGFVHAERANLRNMCVKSGIKYCGELAREWTTHLVVNDTPGALRAKPSTKLEKAVEWSIPAVRLQWLLDSLEQGRPEPIQQYVIAAAAAPQTERRSSVSSNELDAALTECTPAPATNNPGRPALSCLDNVAAELTAGLRQMSISPKAAQSAGHHTSPTLHGALSYPELRSSSGDEEMTTSPPAAEPACDDCGADTSGPIARWQRSLAPIQQPTLSFPTVASQDNESNCDDKAADAAPSQPAAALAQPHEERSTSQHPAAGPSLAAVPAAVRQRPEVLAGVAKGVSQADAAVSGDTAWGTSEDDSCDEVPSPEARPRRIPTDTTQLPGPLLVARPRGPPPALPPGTAADDGVVPLKLLLRAPRGTGVKERHSLPNLKAVRFAEQVHMRAAAGLRMTLGTKDKKMALQLRSSAAMEGKAGAGEEKLPGAETVGEERPLLGEAQCFYQLPGAGQPWRVEYLRFYRAVEAGAAAAAMGKPLALPCGFDRSCELLRSTRREAAAVADAEAVVIVRKVAAKPNNATLTVRGAGTSSYFWRGEFDPDTASVVAD